MTFKFLKRLSAFVAVMQSLTCSRTESTGEFGVCGGVGGIVRDFAAATPSWDITGGNWELFDVA